MSNNLAGLKNGLNGLGTWLEHHRVGTDTEKSCHQEIFRGCAHLPPDPRAVEE
jgi:uncharacterized protein with von Willebrand factor type A (vWA) domain